MSYLIRHLSKALQLIIISMICISCDPNEGCIDADDFGFANFTVSARYKSEDIIGIKENQDAKWKDSGYYANGRPIMVVVKYWNKYDFDNSSEDLSGWTAWFGSKDEHMNVLPKIVAHLPECIIDDYNCLNGIADDNLIALPVRNAPCIFTKGVGLYGLINKPGAADPNSSVTTMRNPNGLNFHVGEKIRDDNFATYSIDKNGHLIKFSSRSGNTHAPDANNIIYLNRGMVRFNYDLYQESSETLKRNYYGGKLYFRIMDSHYEDNSGHYQFTIKSGINSDIVGPIYAIINVVKYTLFGAITNPKSPDMKDTLDRTGKDIAELDVGNVITGAPQGALNIVTNLINPQNRIFGSDSFEADKGVVRRMFEKIISYPPFVNTIKITLTLYIIFSAILFLLGMVEITKQEFLMRVFKMFVVVQLITQDSSWNFFYNYLFFYFLNGVEYVTGAALSASLNTDSGLMIFDNMLSIFTSPQTLKKLLALLLANPFQGIVYIVIYLVIVFHFFKIVFSVVITYMFSLLIIGLLIVLAPIFISFLLFDYLKEFFDNWVKILISYTLQPIFMLVGIGMISLFILDYIHKSLGYRVCYKSLVTVDVPILNKPISLVGWWVPVPGVNYSLKNIGAMVTNNIGIPGAPTTALDLGFSRKTDVILAPDAHMKADKTFCSSYECLEKRYVELPFLNPDKAEDQQIANNFFAGQFIQFKMLFNLLILVWIMGKFNKYSISIAQVISGAKDPGKALGKSSNSAIKQFNQYYDTKNPLSSISGAVMSKIGGGSKKKRG